MHCCVLASANLGRIPASAARQAAAPHTYGELGRLDDSSEGGCRPLLDLDTAAALAKSLLWLTLREWCQALGRAPAALEDTEAAAAELAEPEPEAELEARDAAGSGTSS